MRTGIKISQEAEKEFLGEVLGVGGKPYGWGFETYRSNADFKKEGWLCFPYAGEFCRGPP